MSFFGTTRRPVRVIGEDKIVPVKEMVTTPVAPTVEEIHDDFHTAISKLLKENSDMLIAPIPANIVKGQRLNQLGFTSAAEALEARVFMQKLEELKYIQQISAEYALRYPNNRFITNDVARKLCRKYNLVMGKIDRYQGTVPELNLKAIEEFKKHPEDVEMEYYVWNGGYHKVTKEHYDNAKGTKQSQPSYDALYICAPQKDMRIEHYEKIDENGKIVPLDPIVLKEIKGGYLIVTAWGPEASDEDVVNHKMN